MAAEVIPNRRDLDIRNTGALPRGTGCRYLEVLRAHVDGVFIAVRWCRKLPATGVVIDVDAVAVAAKG